ncbi:MAG: hypothetical protein WCG34_00635 [Leptolinea sp.]
MNVYIYEENGIDLESSARTEDEQDAQKSRFDPIRLAKILTKDSDEITQALALRKDVVTFLTYLKIKK